VKRASELTNRMQGPARPSQREREYERVVQAPIVESEPARLQRRLAVARAVRPPKGVCCGHCFGNGRDAAIRAIEDQG
jgi:hypothetical protein